MKILISREQLELLLEKKRDFIGKKITIAVSYTHLTLPTT